MIHNNFVKIYNTLGILIKTEKSTKVNVSQLSKGNYILKIKTDFGEKVEKFIKE
ncbi:T9SS type A sorting domain-containing protein [Epilithonimonas zeae]|uniref:T9SS type A sorting domain-containing protein n=1 Tax=Epilithonimonas zeae TaxID=1416779 RepID=UPI00200F92A9|nr:T9SS type A sorting domain-containing protein [Epilithonimonas zeae]UQB69149.1 T9SS type A sorting domain-containing protein [Epilithonimonas zeae]